MSPIDLNDALWAVCLGLPLSFLAIHVQRMRGEARKIVLIAEDLVALLAEGDFDRANSRLEEVGGSLGRDTQDFLHQLLLRPWVGAGEAVRIADACVTSPRARALFFAGAPAVPFGLMVNLSSYQHVTEQGGLAVATFGVVACICGFALPLYADACKGRIIRALHEVQHAAETWLAAHGKEGKLI